LLMPTESHHFKKIAVDKGSLIVFVRTTHRPVAIAALSTIANGIEPNTA
jgi:hypothetical protein